MIDHVRTKTVRIAVPPERAGESLGFPGRSRGQTQEIVLFPLLASLVLLAVVVAVHWSVWDAFRGVLRESAPLATPLVALLAAIVLLPPLAWAISAL
jgi:hypothetical protein